MNVGEVFGGLGLCAWGVAFCALARWQVRDDSRMRRMAESRWRLDRFSRESFAVARYRRTSTSIP
jgi:hypothetical protein